MYHQHLKCCTVFIGVAGTLQPSMVRPARMISAPLRLSREAWPASRLAVRVSSSRDGVKVFEASDPAIKEMIEFLAEGRMTSNFLTPRICSGDFIFSFKSLAPIIYYNSPVGNNDVPYPYAIDKENNTYLLTDDFVLIKPNPLILKLIKENNYDAYDIYYEFINPSKYSRVNKLIRKTIKETKFEIKSLQYNTIYIIE